jgi:hypothetical protein
MAADGGAVEELTAVRVSAGSGRQKVDGRQKTEE